MAILPWRGRPDAGRRRRRPSRAYRPALGMERVEERTLLSVSLVSANGAGTASGDGGSILDASSLEGGAQPGRSQVSADGRFVVFASNATDLDPNAKVGGLATNVYVRDLQTGRTSLVSVTPGGQDGDGPSSHPIISPDGRYVAFLSQADDLTANGKGGAGSNPGGVSTPTAAGVGSLYLRDLATGTTTLVESTPQGGHGNGLSTGDYLFSPDGHWLAFTSTDTDLTNNPVAPPTGSGSTGGSAATPVGGTNLFVRNMQTQTNAPVSVTPDGRITSGAVYSGLVFSPDGKMLAFLSTATDLTANATPPPTPNPVPGYPAIPYSGTNAFVRDLEANTTTLASVTAGGALAQNVGPVLAFSPDGQSLAFTSTDTDLTANPLTPPPTIPSSGGMSPVAYYSTNVFVRDLKAGATTLASVTPDGKLSLGQSGNPVFSPDGKRLAFTSTATDLTANPVDPTGLSVPAGTQVPASALLQPPYFSGLNVFVRDLAGQTTTLASVTTAGKLPASQSGAPAFSPDGKMLAFTSNATSLTANPVNPLNGAVLSSGSSGGTVGPTPMTSVPLVSNNVFLRDLQSNTTELVSVTADGTLGQGQSPAFSPDGHSIAFVSSETDLTRDPVAQAPASTTPASPTISPYGGIPSPTPTTPPPNGPNVYVRDLPTRTTTLVSISPDGKTGDGPSDAPVFSPDGQSIFFQSLADNLAPGDTNQADDIFDATRQVGFAAGAVTASPSGGQAVVTVRRTGLVGGPATVAYAVVDGTAHAGQDYLPVSGTLTFAPGESVKTFSVPILPTGSSTPRAAALVLADPQGASLGAQQALLMITNAPASPPAQGSPTSPVLAAGAGPAVASAVIPGGRQSNQVVITFSAPLDPARAGVASYYTVSLKGRTIRTRRGTRTAPDRPLAVARASYNPTTNAVTLTLRNRLQVGQSVQLAIRSGPVGLTDTAGHPLNSPGAGQPGIDYSGVVTRS
jgi:Tol biopolymer transport system component